MAGFCNSYSHFSSTQSTFFWLVSIILYIQISTLYLIFQAYPFCAKVFLCVRRLKLVILLFVLRSLKALNLAFRKSPSTDTKFSKRQGSTEHLGLKKNTLFFVKKTQKDKQFWAYTNDLIIRNKESAEGRRRIRCHELKELFRGVQRAYPYLKSLLASQYVHKSD